MIVLERDSFTFNHTIFRLNESYREFRKIVTIVEFAVYKPKKQVLPLVQNEIKRVYFTHWDNLKVIPKGQIELFGYDDADPDEPPEPPELDDSISIIPKRYLTKSDVQSKGFWRTKRGFHPVTPVVGLLAEYVVRCDVLPQSKQVKMCQQRIRQQRSRIQDLKNKKRPASEIKNSLLIICEEKQRICDFVSK